MGAQKEEASGDVPRRDEEKFRREEAYGAAFCFALNRLRLRQEGFNLSSNPERKSDGGAASG